MLSLIVKADIRAAVNYDKHIRVIVVLSVVCIPWDVPVVLSWNRVLLNHQQRKRATDEHGCFDRLNASRNYEQAPTRCYSKSPSILFPPKTIVYSSTARSFDLFRVFR